MCVRACVSVCEGGIQKGAPKYGHTRDHEKRKGKNVGRVRAWGEYGHFWTWNQQIYQFMSNIDLNQPQKELAGTGSPADVLLSCWVYEPPIGPAVIKQPWELEPDQCKDDKLQIFLCVCLWEVVQITWSLLALGATGFFVFGFILHLYRLKLKKWLHTGTCKCTQI